jgi:HEAT repeat protein
MPLKVACPSCPANVWTWSFMLAGVLFLSPIRGDDPDLKELAEGIDRGSPELRVKSMERAGEMGPKARSLLRNMANALLSREKKVRDAALTAMKRIDDNVGTMAAKILVNFNDVNMEDVTKQGAEVAEPLLPLLIRQYETLVGTAKPSDRDLSKAQTVLDCLYLCTPEDAESNKVILKALKSPHVKLQHTGVIAARTMKDGKKGVPDVLRIAKTCPNEGIRLEAIRTAGMLADATNKATVAKSLGELRLDKSEAVRRAVDDALEKVNAK